MEAIAETKCAVVEASTAEEAVSESVQAPWTTMGERVRARGVLLAAEEEAMSRTSQSERGERGEVLEQPSIFIAEPGVQHATRGSSTVELELPYVCNL